MCHLGSVATDLCFFLCSSTTPTFRQSHWDDMINLYFREFTTALQDLLGDSSNAKIPTLDDFLLDVKASIPLSVFFCANLRDLDNSGENAAVVDPLADFSSNMDQIYGSNLCSSQSIQNLHGTFHKLQNSYSLYMMGDPSTSSEMMSIDEDCNDDTDDEEDDEEDDDGIIISFGHRTSTRPALSTVRESPSETSSQKSLAPTPQEYKRSSSDLVMLERKPVTKVPTVATDQELLDILEARCSDQKSFRNKLLTPRKARALRRKLYLDLYSEVAQRMLI